MKAIILSIGDELVLGQTVDTNSAWLSQHLAGVGCDIVAHMTVGDEQKAIEQAIEESVGRCDALVISGGIGPTDDDLTRQALAGVMQAPLELNQAWLDHMSTYFTRLDRKMPPSNNIQAMIPRGATMIWNHHGTAAGIDAMFQSGDQKTTCHVFVMPGVPREMKGMFTRDVLPHIQKASGGAAIVSRTLHTFGLGESTVAERLGELMKRGRNPSVGTTVAGGVVSLRINARSASPTEAEAQADETAAACQGVLGDIICGSGEETLPTVIAKMLREHAGEVDPASKKTHLTIATAESCTGGLLAKLLTDIPGSSAYFTQGWVTYSNRAKYERLGVNEEVINVYGAVSEPVVEAMARSARRLAKSDFALAISGVAGPDGGTETKPVGTVCIALASKKSGSTARGDDRYIESDVIPRTFHLPGDREMMRLRSAFMALTMLRFHLLGRPLPF